MSRTRVLIVGAAGWNNVGDDLIADALVRWVERSGAVARVAGGPFKRSVGDFVLSGRLVDKFRVALAVATSDFVVIGGGGLLDDRLANFYRPYTRVAALCRALRRGYAFVGIGVGPVQSPSSRAEYAAAVDGADQVMVRDISSRQRLIDCGVTASVDVVADPVLWELKDPTTKHQYDLTVNLRNWHTEARPQLRYSGPTDDQIVMAVADAINATYGPEARIALVSMSGIGQDDDSTLLEDLRHRLRASTETHYSLSTHDVVSTISCSSAVLSMRLHTCLVGAAYRKKVVGLAYDPKVTAQAEIHGFSSISLDSDLSSSNRRIQDALLEAKPAVPRAKVPAPCW